MKFLITFLFTCFSVSFYAQEIDSLLYTKTWLDKETRVFNNYQITKEFGQLPRMPSAYNFMPITAVSYKDFHQLKTDLLEKVDVDQLSDSLRNSKIHKLEKNAGGGEIQIYVSRYSEEEANFKWFFVILRSEEDKNKLWEYELDYQAPQNPYERGWWNYITVNIPVELSTPFYIYLNDKHSKYLSDFKFRVDYVNED